jgi:hypothetical protein
MSVDHLVQTNVPNVNPLVFSCLTTPAFYHSAEVEHVNQNEINSIKKRRPSGPRL